jgi:hypothetical protein
MTDPMSGGDATSRGHLNADDGAGGRDLTGPDIQAAGAGAEPPGGDTREQGEAAGPSPIGGSPEADAAEVGGNEAGWPKVAGECPMGCGRTLFLGSGGHVTCSLLGCPNPAAADEWLHLEPFGRRA